MSIVNSTVSAEDCLQQLSYLLERYPHLSSPILVHISQSWLEQKRNVMAHGNAREEKWREKRRMEWVASTHALYGNTVYPALLPLMRTTRLPAAEWTDTPADINGLVRFAGKPNLVSARVPSHSVSALPQNLTSHHQWTRVMTYH